MAAKVSLVDYRYSINEKSPATWVHAFSVFAPIFGRVDSQAMVLDYSQRLLGQWRRRVYSLLDSGWDTDRPKMLDARKRVILNCRPCAAITKPRSLGCHLHFCPQCWARRTAEMWQTLNDNLFFNALRVDALPIVRGNKIYRPKPEPGTRCTHSLALVERRFVVPVEDYRDGDWVAGLPLFLEWRNAPKPKGGKKAWHPIARGLDLARYYPEGLFETITPIWKRSEPDWWTIRVRQLMAVEPWKQLKVEPIGDERVSYKRVERPRRSGALKAIAWACRYPRWLLNGPPLMVRRFEADRAGRRLWSTHGIFRGKSQPRELSGPATFPHIRAEVE